MPRALGFRKITQYARTKDESSPKDCEGIALSLTLYRGLRNLSLSHTVR